MVQNLSITVRVRSKSDCLVCAIRPSLTFCKVNIFNCVYSCPHSSSTQSQAEFKASLLFQLLNLFCNSILIVAVINDVKDLAVELKPRHLFTIMQISINICVIYCNTTYINAAKHKVKEYNGLLSVINHKLIFGMKNILSDRRCRSINRKMFRLVVVCCCLELLNFSFLLALNFDNFLEIVTVIASEISMISLIGVLLYFIQNSHVYVCLAEKCFSEVQTALERGMEKDIVRKLEGLQRFYMALRSNFVLSGTFMSPSVIVFYISNTVILIISLTYIVLLYFRGDIKFDTYDYQIFVKSLIICLGQVFFCFEAEKLNKSVQTPLSNLLKFRISKLDKTGSIKVENLINLMIQQSLRVRASELFVISSELIVSLVATGITYVLVALQFHLFW